MNYGKIAFWIIVCFAVLFVIAWSYNIGEIKGYNSGYEVGNMWSKDSYDLGYSAGNAFGFADMKQRCSSIIAGETPIPLRQ